MNEGKKHRHSYPMPSSEASIIAELKHASLLTQFTSSVELLFPQWFAAMDVQNSLSLCGLIRTLGHCFVCGT